MRIRRPTDDDSLAVATVHVRAWQAGYRGLLPASSLDSLSPPDRAQRYTFDSMTTEGPYTLIAEDDEAVLGLVTMGRCRDDGLTALGEVWALYVEPRRWRAGIGSGLLQRAVRELRNRGYAAATLWVMADNHRARRFYEAAGWTADGCTRMDVVAGATINEVRYRRALS